MARILAVDDDLLVRTWLRAVLDGDGHEVVVCDSAASALARLGGGYEPELILLDLRMPEAAGNDFLAALNARPGPRPPVAILSSYPAELKSEGDLAAVLAKPVPAANLLAKVAEVLALQSREGGESCPTDS